MKRLLICLAGMSILMFACNLPSLPTQSPAAPTLGETPTIGSTISLETTNNPEITSTPEATGTQMATETTAPVANVTCNELSFHLDPVLTSINNCETIPASTEGIEIYPQYTKVTLQGYTPSEHFFAPQISVFPVQQYLTLLPDFIPGQVSGLETLIGGGIAGDSLPFLPLFNAAQLFHAQNQAIPFISGGGIRYLTLYAQYFAPINNHDLFYTYQGLTSDGNYWVSAILPVTHPTLPANGDTIPGGMSLDEFTNNYGIYLADMVNQLNLQTGDSYTPHLTVLDALVSSIKIQP
jgi:hypothetical protein